jgi:hypothetical protein
MISKFPSVIEKNKNKEKVVGEPRQHVGMNTQLIVACSCIVTSCLEQASYPPKVAGGGLKPQG